MTSQAKILCFAGSLRRDSFNKKLVKIAMAAAKEAGAEVTFIDLADYPLPIYNGDDETANGLPENATKLKALFKEHNGFLIASPEYNSSLSAALKNVIDWVSRPAAGEKPLQCFTGKIAGVMAASPGGYGGLRGLVTVRSILGNIGVHVIPDQVAVASADKAFDDQGQLKDEKISGTVQSIGKKVADVARRLHS